MLLYSLVITVVMGVLFGLSPALLLRRIDLSQSARSRVGSACGHGLRSARTALVVNQIALTMVLLLGAGLLIRSFVKLTRVELGYDPANVLTFQIAHSRLPQEDFAKFGIPAQLRFQSREAAFADAVVTRLRSVPSVQSAGFTTALPMVNGRYGVALMTTPTKPMESVPGSNALSVSRDYLRVMGIRVIAGRGFNDSDRTGPRAVLMNRTLARQYFGEANPLGKRVFGLAGGVAVTRYLEKMLFGLTPLDPATFLIVPALFTVVALIACYFTLASALSHRYFYQGCSPAVPAAEAHVADLVVNASTLRQNIEWMLRQPVGEVRRRTEGGDAPGWQGATTENIGNI